MAMKTEQVLIYDTTLRDGSQGEGISFSRNDKMRLAQALDALGVSYIEGGWPGSNPKDIEFFREAARQTWKHAKICAFGSTRHCSVRTESDENLRRLLEAETPAAAIFGKSWLLHVEEVLRTTPDENLTMIRESCAFLADAGREVIYDAEHFFDGYKANPDYALDTVRAAVAGGASTVTLCDTNGGTLPLEIKGISESVRKILPVGVILGIHCHNDSGMAVANSLMGVRAGARHVQGTMNGFGERCGNTNLCSIVPILELKTEYWCLPEGNLADLKKTSDFVNELANLRHNTRLPFIGDSAFAHKGGMHVNAVAKNPATFEHINPASVGNRRRILVSDLSGRSNLILKAQEEGFDLGDEENVRKILEELKRRENEGYEYEGADASFLVMLHKLTGRWNRYFTLEGFRVIVEKRGHSDSTIAEATVKLSVNGVSELTAAEGAGPVNALDLALRKSLERFYPELKGTYLSDFKVRILESDDGTASKTRVWIESRNGQDCWNTVGLSENIIQASWEALADSVEYALYKRNAPPVKPDTAEGDEKR